MNLDAQILNSAFNLYLNNPHLQRLFLFFADDLVYVLVLILVGLWFVKKNRLHFRQALVEAFISFVFARVLLTELIRFFLPRERPHVADFLYYFSTAKASEPSFPSGHASAMFAIATSVYLYNRKYGIWLLILSVVTGIFRVIVGYHFPSDIVGGVMLGILVAMLTHKYLHKFSAKITSQISKESDLLLPFTK